MFCAGVAQAQDEEVPDETERWVPSFSLRSGVTATNMSASVDSFVVPRAGPFINTVRPTIRTYSSINPAAPSIPLDQKVFLPKEGEVTVMGPWVGTQIELMTPGLQFLPTRPRLFVHGDIQYNFAVPRSIVREGAPAAPPTTGLPPGYRLTFDRVTAAALNAMGVVDPVLPGVPPGPPEAPVQVTFPIPVQSTLLFPVQAGVPLVGPIVVRGQGSKVEVTEHPWIWQVGGGTAFTFELFERRLRVKPSIEYQRRKLTIKTVANRALPSAQPGVFTTGVQPVFNIIQLSAEDELDIHGLGPGLELEMDTWQAGPFMLSLFMAGQAYRALGETQVTATGGGVAFPCTATDGSNQALLCQRTFDVPSPQTGQPTATGLGINDIYGDFSFEIDPWTYQAGVGLRFRLVPDRWIPEALTNLEMPEFETPAWLPW